MDYVQKAKQEERERAYTARSRTASRYARMVLWLTAAVFLFAVWQDRALAPRVHDGMIWTGAKLVSTFEGLEEYGDDVKGTLRSGASTSMKAEYDPITSWLLRNRN